MKSSQLLLATIISLTSSGAFSNTCVDLLAGKNETAGQVCVQSTSENLSITYHTFDNWVLSDTHLFIGKSYSEIPKTKIGNPKIGLFPYGEQTINASNYAYSTHLNVLNLTCGQIITIAAHAGLSFTDESSFTRTETGWANGLNISEKGSWAMYFNYLITCPPPPPPKEVTCETAFALGDTTFIELGITNSRWGWQFTVNENTSGVRPLYAGAAQNNINKGTHVGNLIYSYDGFNLKVKYALFDGFGLEETHLYAGLESVQTTAPGQFGNIHENLKFASQDSFQLVIAGDALELVAHAKVCK